VIRTAIKKHSFTIAVKKILLLGKCTGRCNQSGKKKGVVFHRNYFKLNKVNIENNGL